MYRIYILFFEFGSNKLLKKSVIYTDSLEEALLKSYYVLRDFENKKRKSKDWLNTFCDVLITENIEIDFERINDFYEFDELILQKYLNKEYYNKVYYIFDYTNIDTPDYEIFFNTGGIVFKYGHFPQYLPNTLVFDLRIEPKIVHRYVEPRIVDIKVTDDFIRKLISFLPEFYSLRKCNFKLDELYVVILIKDDSTILKSSIKYKSDRFLFDFINKLIKSYIRWNGNILFIKASKVPKILSILIRNKVSYRDVIKILKDLECNSILIDIYKSKDIVLYFQTFILTGNQNYITNCITLHYRYKNNLYDFNFIRVETERVKEFLEYIRTLLIY